MLKRNRNSLAFFFGGIRDARNLYATILEIDRLEQSVAKRHTRTYHATMNDVNPRALARDLVMFHLLDELKSLPISGENNRTALLATIFFMFIGAVVPSYVSDRIQKAAEAVLIELQSKNSHLHWLKIYDRDRPELIRVLKSWKSKLKSIWNPAEVTERLIWHYRDSNQNHRRLVDEDKPRAGCKQEIKYFLRMGVLWPPLFKIKEPNSAVTTRPDGGSKSSKSHVLQGWRVNVTMLDPDWAKGPDEAQGGWSFDPYDLMESFYERTNLQEPANTSALYHYVANFFEHVVLAMRRLDGRLTIEMIHGEVSKTMEQIRYGFLERQQGFPNKYNAVHLSNIPLVLDYKKVPITT